MTFKYPEYLVETEWLAEHLGDPDLRILDCTVFRRNTDQLDEQGRVIRTLESGHGSWAAGHIPGSTFADLVEDLKQVASADIITSGHALVRNLQNGFSVLAAAIPRPRRLATAWPQLAAMS